MKKVLFQIKENKELQLFIFLFIIIIISFLWLKPHIAGDSFDYLNSIQFLKTGIKSVDFAPNRLLTTFGALELLIFLSFLFHSTVFAWIFINTCFYLIFNFLFYKVLIYIHKDERVALLGTLFLATNYALAVFGLNFLMDMGGWMFYMISIYFSYKYLYYKNRKNILLSALAVGFGVLFKEYAVLGVIPIALILIYENFRKNNYLSSIKNIIFNSFFPALLAIVPLTILYFFIYFKFGYTYIDWLQTNNERYPNFNRLNEYIKSFGSLLNFLGVLFLIGLFSLYKKWPELEERNKVFITAVFMSFLPLFLWPGITQRVLFISVPALMLVASYGIKRFENKLSIIELLLVVYFLASLFMDSYILIHVNLPF
jgi:hypothetical protein